MKSFGCSRGLLVLLVIMGCLLMVASASAADAATTWSFGAGDRATFPQTITVAEDKIAVDLSALPEEATVFRAILRCQREERRRDKVVVVPANSPEERIPLLAPRFASLDATAAVSRAVEAGEERLAFVVKRFSGWIPETLRLDISFVGAGAKNAPPAPDSLRGHHRAGQTLLTWREAHSPVPDEKLTIRALRDIRATVDRTAEVRYRIYRHGEPISPATISEAELVDEVPPLTCWNDEFYGVSPDPNALALRYAVEDGEGPVAPGTGIYANNPGSPGKSYYAVTSAINGEENLSSFSDGNSLATALDETVGPGQPILQRIEKPETFLYFDNPTLHYFVRWEAPPRSNVPSRPFDYLVGIPPDLPRPAPLGLHLHCWGANLNGGYIWWYKAREGAILVASNQIPYDWWMSYHEGLGTWKAWDEGVTRDFTVKRLLSFVDWVASRWEVDRERVFVTGASMGGSGASMIAVRYPKRFTFALSSVGVHDAANSPQFTGSYERVCGDVGSSILHESGMPTFDYLDNAHLLRLNPGRDVPFISFTNGKNDSGIGWPQAAGFVKALQETRQPHLFTWGQSGHGQRVYAPTPTGGGDNAMPILDVQLARSVPAFTQCSLDDDIGNGDPADGGPEGQINLYLRWETNGVVDEEGLYEVTVYLIESAPKNECTVNITPRRCQRFKPAPGAKFAWTNSPRELAESGIAPEGNLRSDEVTADEWGLVTLKQVRVSKAGNRIRIVQR